LIAAERTALHIAAEDVQLTFLCAAITAVFALCHSFPPYPILPRASPGIWGLPVAASVAYLCSHHVVAFPPGTNRYPQAVEWTYALLRVAAGLMLVPHVWPKLMAGPTAIAANVMARRGLEPSLFFAYADLGH
jgi:hypothetical protein